MEHSARRLQHEIGVAVPLDYHFKFVHHATFGGLGSERELCWVFTGAIDPEDVAHNRTEIDEIRWVSPAELDAELREHPEHFTFWLHLKWEWLGEDLLV